MDESRRRQVNGKLKPKGWEPRPPFQHWNLVAWIAAAIALIVLGYL